MTISHLLEDFAPTNPDPGSLRLMSQVALEDERLAAFEQGYTAGWEDAVKARGSDHERLVSHLSRALEDMSFTYHEALTEMTGAARSVFEAVLDQLLPETLEPVFVGSLADRLTALAQEKAAASLELVLPVGTGAFFGGAVEAPAGLPLVLSEDPELLPGQAIIRLDTDEEFIDLSGLIAEIDTSIRATLASRDESADHA